MCIIRLLAILQSCEDGVTSTPKGTRSVSPLQIEFENTVMMMMRVISYNEVITQTFTLS